MTTTAIAIELPASWEGKKPSPEQLKEILRLHSAYFRGEAEGRRANLYGANLRGANLGGANLGDETRLPAGFVWREYLEELVPQLLTAAGKKLEEVANEVTWECHSWGEEGAQMACPIATAFSVHRIDKVPLLYREQANFFISLFDARMIPLDRVLKRSKETAS